MAATSVAKSNFSKPPGVPTGKFVLPVGCLRQEMAVAIEIAAVLQIIMTKAVLKPHGSVWGIAAIIKLVDKISGSRSHFKMAINY
jgi:hypothetical protein